MSSKLTKNHVFCALERQRARGAFRPLIRPSIAYRMFIRPDIRETPKCPSNRCFSNGFYHFGDMVAPYFKHPLRVNFGSLDSSENWPGGLLTGGVY